MRVWIAAALAAMATPAIADMTIVCETPWFEMTQRLEIALPDEGMPVVGDHFVGKGESPPLFGDNPRVLGHALTKADGKPDGTPFSSIMVESKVTDKGVERYFPARVYYVDWGRAKVWQAFMSLLDAPGSSEVEGCRRTD